MNIYPRLLQNKCRYRETRGERATKRNEESRNPEATSTFFPSAPLGVSRLRSHDIDGRIKISSDPLPPRLSIWRRLLLLRPAHFPESSDIYFCRPETPVPFADCSASGIQSAFIHFRFRMKKFGRNDNRPNKVRLPEARRTPERVSISRIALEMTFIESYT